MGSTEPINFEKRVLEPINFGEKIEENELKLIEVELILAITNSYT